jgi:hypothetical protein
MREYWCAHRGQMKVYRRQHYLNNRGQILAATKDYRSKHHQWYRNYLKSYYEQHKTEHKKRGSAWATANRQKCRAANARWVANDPDHYKAIKRAKENKRRALKAASSCDADRSAYKAFCEIVVKTPRMRCYWCNKPTRPHQRHVDHIVPLTRGGPDHVLNLCCSCALCNMKKNAKAPEVFSGQHLIEFVPQM